MPYMAWQLVPYTTPQCTLWGSEKIMTSFNIYPLRQSVHLKDIFQTVLEKNMTAPEVLPSEVDRITLIFCMVYKNV